MTGDGPGRTEDLLQLGRPILHTKLGIGRISFYVSYEDTEYPVGLVMCRIRFLMSRPFFFRSILTRVGPDIRQCRIIRSDFSICRISGQIIRPYFSFCREIRPDIRHIRPDLAGTGHPASGMKYQIRPNPSNEVSQRGME